MPKTIPNTQPATTHTRTENFLKNLIKIIFTEQQASQSMLAFFSQETLGTETLSPKLLSLLHQGINHLIAKGKIELLHLLLTHPHSPCATNPKLLHELLARESHALLKATVSHNRIDAASLLLTYEGSPYKINANFIEDDVVDDILKDLLPSPYADMARYLLLECENRLFSQHFSPAKTTPYLCINDSIKKSYVHVDKKKSYFFTAYLMAQRDAEPEMLHVLKTYLKQQSSDFQKSLSLWAQFQENRPKKTTYTLLVASPASPAKPSYNPPKKKSNVHAAPKQTYVTTSPTPRAKAAPNPGLASRYPTPTSQKKVLPPSLLRRGLSSTTFPSARNGGAALRRTSTPGGPNATLFSRRTVVRRSSTPVCTARSRIPNN